MLPVRQIPADGMAPVHRPPVFVVGVVLIERMINAVNVHQPIGIVDPAGGRRQMKLRVVIVLTLGAQGFDRMVGLS
ncbi:hypothetical protein D3C80_1977340 [compost metagenome]